MRSLDIKLVLPYNWYHARRIKICDDKGKVLTKIMHNEHHQVTLDNEVEFIIIKLDFLRSKIEVPKGQTNLYLGVYMDFRDKFPIMYYDILKRKCLTGMFLDENKFENFDVSIYGQSKKYILKSEVNLANVLLGMLISVGLIVTSVWEQDNENNSLVFFIGMVSFFSLLMIKLSDGKLSLYDYRNRVIATGAAFILSAFFVENAYPVRALLIIFTLGFIFQAYKNFSTVKT